MEQSQRFTRREREVLLGIPALFPDGDSDDLEISGASREEISCAVQQLIGAGLVHASSHEGATPFAPYYRDVVLTAEGEALRRNLARPWLVRLSEREWKWLF